MTSFAPQRGRPQFYFSLRSPYSWLAWHDLSTHHPQVLQRLQWLPFWEPDECSTAMLAASGAAFPYTPMSRAKHLYVLQDVRRLTRERGLHVTWPADRDPCWEIPHLAYVAVVQDDASAGPRWVARVYRARWQEGLDICDTDVVARLAEDAGFDPDRLAGAANDQALREQGLQALVGICREGIFGVPYFVHRYERFWGLDRLDALLAALPAEPAPHDEREPQLSVAGCERATDGGHAGGCG